MNQQTVPHDIIMRGRMFLKPNRLMSSWTGNSAVRKDSNWIVVPWTGVGFSWAFMLQEEKRHIRCCSRWLSYSNHPANYPSTRSRDCRDPVADRRTVDAFLSVRKAGKKKKKSSKKNKGFEIFFQTIKHIQLSRYMSVFRTTAASSLAVQMAAAS